MTTRSIGITAILAAAAIWPAGAWGGQDWRSPDARAAGQPKPVLQDLRSPDARDVAAHRPVATARVIAVSSDSFDWGDAAIGAAGATGIALLLAGVGTAMMRRRTRALSASG